MFFLYPFSLVSHTSPPETVTSHRNGLHHLSRHIDHNRIYCHWDRSLLFRIYLDTVYVQILNQIYLISDKRIQTLDFHIMDVLFVLANSKNLRPYVLLFSRVLHMASSFWSLPIQIIHPLYESQGFGCVCRKLDRFDLKSEHKQYQGKYGIIVSGPSDNRFDYDLYVEKDGVVHYDVKLLSLEERYVKPMKMGTEKTLGFLSTMRNQKFLLDIYKQKNKKIDIDAISKTYKKWLKDFPESQELRHSVEEFENEAIKYRHWMGEN